MSLRDRLDRLLTDSPESRPAAPRRAVPAPPDFRRIAPGFELDGPAGRCYVAESVFPLDHRHGAIPLGAALVANPGLHRLLAGSGCRAGVDLVRTAFLDTETTGLAGGTGTYPFLIGVGFFAAPEPGQPPDRFVVRQYTMRDYSEEPAQIAALSALLAGFSSVVTFNGRAFDLPLIETRYRINRQRLPWRDPAHLDLLFPARAVWRERLASCALKDLEPPVLGVRRQGDVPGWLIPNLYFEYLRTRDPRPLRSVFSHNLLDILSLATLLARLTAILDDPGRVDPADGYGAGRIFEAAGDSSRAVACYEQALTGRLPPILRRRCLQRLSLLHKRAGTWTAAVAVWERCLAEPDPDLFGHRELAKYYEHVVRDHRRAVQIVERALFLLEIDAAAGRPEQAGSWHEWERRRVRLITKLSAGRP